MVHRVSHCEVCGEEIDCNGKHQCIRSAKLPPEEVYEEPTFTLIPWDEAAKKVIEAREAYHNIMLGALEAAYRKMNET